MFSSFRLIVFAALLPFCLQAQSYYIPETLTGVGANAAVIATNVVTNKVYVATNTGGASTVSIVDGTSYLATNVTAGGDPSDIAINSLTNKIYVVARGSNSVTVIDGATNSTLTLPVGRTPQHAAVNSVTNKIYVTNSGDNTITVIDGATNSTTTIATGGSSPSSVCINPATNKIYVANFGGNNVAVIDGLTNSITSVPVGLNPIQIAVNSITNTVYVANSSSGSVTVIAGATNSTQNISVLANPQALLANPATNTVFVSYTGSPYLTKIDAATNTTFTLPLGPTNQTYPTMLLAMNLVTNEVFVGNFPTGFLLAVDGLTDHVYTVEVLEGASVFALNPVTDTFYVSTPQGLAVVSAAPNRSSTVSTGNKPQAVAGNPVTGKAYVTNYTDSTVTVLDGSGNVDVTIPTGLSPTTAAVNPIANKTYVLNQGDNSVTVIDGTSNSTVSIPIGTSPSTVAINPVTNKVYLVTPATRTVTVINGSDNSTTTVPVGVTPNSLAVNPVTNEIYVGNAVNNILTVIDGATNSTSTIAITTLSQLIAVNPVTNKVYVASFSGSNVSVIDGSTKSVTSVSVGTNATGMALNSITNKIYVAGSRLITVIDGSTLLSTTITTYSTSSPASLVVDPASNKIYLLDQANNEVLVIDGVSNTYGYIPIAAGSSAIAVNPVTSQIYVANAGANTLAVFSQNANPAFPLTNAITPLANNQPSTSVPAFTFTAAGTTALQPHAVLYQFDTIQASWTQASGTNPAFVSAPTVLQPGIHTLYAYATAGQESSSDNTGQPIVGAIQAYTFLVVPVALATQSITFPPINSQSSGTSLTLTATASSGLTVVYSSSAPTVCTVSGNVAALNGAGTCTITASQIGNASYSPAQPVTQSFTVTLNVPVNGSPVISNIQAVTVGGNSVLITWITDQPSTSQVLYGATSSYGQSTAVDSSLVTNHSVTVSGLAPGAAYSFAVVSANSNSASTTSPSSTITISPYVGYVAFWGVSSFGVTISWSTDTPASSFVAFGTSSALGQVTPEQLTASNGHGVVLTNLNPGTTYYFRAESTTAAGNTGASTLYSFTTTGNSALPAPAISKLLVTQITTTSAAITWTTDQVASSQVNYGLTSAYGSSSPLNSSLVTSHSVLLNGLTPGTTYNYDVVSTGSTGTGTSANYTFVTTAAAAGPVISTIQTFVTANSATITWTTDQAASSQVNYGATSSYGSSSPLDGNLVTSHSVTISGLTAGTNYSFDVVSGNAANQTTTSPSGTFVTTASSATAPYVGYVAAWGITNSGATVTWSTDVSANTQLVYGTTSALGTLTPLQAALANSHGVVLTGLNAGTTYYFAAQSTWANGATGQSAILSFTTGGTSSNPIPVPAPVISNVQVTFTNNSATITWTTDEASSSQVNYGLTTAYTSSSTLDPALLTTHTVALNGLLPGTAYNFDVMSANSSGSSSTSPNATFQTNGAAPSPVINNVAVSGITSSMALITWTTDQASTSQVSYATTTVAGTATLVTSHSVTLTGLAPNTIYSFTVSSANASGISSTSSAYTFTTAPASGPAPVISYVAFWGITNSGITISWSTDVPANTSVAYGITSALGQVTPAQTGLANSHGVMLTGLQPSTTYYFQAQSADMNGNMGASTIYSFTTIAGAPSVSAIVATPGTNNTATIGWTTSVPTYSYVQYGPIAGSYNRYSAQTSLTTSPQCNLPYVPSGAVHYQLVSTDAYGNQYVSPDATLVEP